MHILDNALELVEGIPSTFQRRLAEMKSLDQQAEGISASVKEAKRRLFAEYANLSKSEIEERSDAIKEDYKKMRNLYTKKFELSSDLEQIMDRVNNKIKKDANDFRCELEFENPGVTYELEKRFTEECDKAFYSNRNAEERVSAREAQLIYNGHVSNQRQALNRGRPEKLSHRRTDKSIRKLLIDTSGQGQLLNVRGGRFAENGSATSSFRPSPVGDYSPSPSTSRFSTPRHTPGPVSPAIRSSHLPAPPVRHQNGVNIPQSAPAMFTNPSFPTADSVIGQFDPSATVMPSFASGQESRHGRTRKLTTRVKQMLNEQKVHRSSHHNLFGGAANMMSPLSQGFSLSGQNLPFGPRAGSSSRRQSTSIPRRQKLKRSSVALDEDDGASHGSVDREYGSESAEQDDYEMEGGLDEDGDNVWCLCQTKSYGNMVSCDSPQCPITWFHFKCVGLESEPGEGRKWYCPHCREGNNSSIPRPR